LTATQRHSGRTKPPVLSAATASAPSRPLSVNVGQDDPSPRAARRARRPRVHDQAVTQCGAVQVRAALCRRQHVTLVLDSLARSSNSQCARPSCT
jgi:hypothetical protein